MFDNITPNAEGKDKIEQLRSMYKKFASEIQGVITPGRECAVVMTNLQTSSFFAIRAAAMQNPEIFDSTGTPDLPYL